ncbi:MAG: pantothenate synthase [Chrysothrix sp. TS-e1954]|nr:MAG: pantothenate synthase [Chrysothrix sp. TS-e1954]
MGALHQGHLALAKQAAQENDEVFVSIYVNPTQFGVNEDLGSYPRTFDTDMEKLHKLNGLLEEMSLRGRVTTVFAPTTNTMYPTLPPSSEIEGAGSFVTITPLGGILEGASRPVFFRGVATVCMKLFNIVQPDRVYFGQKDAQQSVLIRRLVKDFHLDVEVRVLATEREPDGLAMSSRNVYLGQRRRAAAVMLPEALKLAEAEYLTHKARSRTDILKPAYAHFESRQKYLAHRPERERVDTQLDYLSLADPEDMHEVEEVDASRGAILSAALKMLPLAAIEHGDNQSSDSSDSSAVRLIDNIVLRPSIET